MGMFNTAIITDIIVKDIITREDITEQLKRLDKEILKVCIANDVELDEIPLGEDGFITSTSLSDFAQFWLMHTLLSDYWGVTGEINDVYKAKVDYFTREMNRCKNDLTYQNITGENLDRQSYVRQVVVY